jgi:hypothetical protein
MPVTPAMWELRKGDHSYRPGLAKVNENLPLSETNKKQRA